MAYDYRRPPRPKMKDRPQGESASLASSSDARFHNPYSASRTADEHDKCAIGPHPAAAHELWFELDGQYVCVSHGMAMVRMWDENWHQGLSEFERRRLQAKEDDLVFKTEREARMREITGQQPGFVYYIRIDQHIKIGYAADVRARMKHYPPSAELLAAHPGTRQLETQMHRDFRRYLDKGREWYDAGPQLLAHIDRVRAQFGDPSMLAYHYKSAKRAS